MLRTNAFGAHRAERAVTGMQVEVRGLIPVWYRLSIVAERAASQSTAQGVGTGHFLQKSMSSPVASRSSSRRGWSLWCEEEGKLLHSPWPRHIFGTCTLVVTYDNELMAS